jgi:hypothetical protein
MRGPLDWMAVTSTAMTTVGMLGQAKPPILPRRRRALGGRHRHGGRERGLLELPALALQLQLLHVALDAAHGSIEEIAKKALGVPAAKSIARPRP